MGLKMWLAKKLLVKEAQHLKSQNQSLLTELNEELKKTSEDYRNALKEAEVTSRILESRRRIKTMRDDLRKISKSIDDEDEDEDEDDFDDDEDDDESDLGDFEKEIMSMIKKPLMDRIKAGGATSTTAAALVPSSLPELTPLKKKVWAQLENLSDDELSAMIAKFS